LLKIPQEGSSARCARETVKLLCKEWP